MQQINLNREDMLELTRRMNLQRNCFGRIAGAYLDEEGFVDGTFNTHFLKLSSAERNKNLKIAKAIPFGETNKNLKGFRLSKDEEKQGSFYQLLLGLRACELQNDAMLDVLYEVLGERYQPGRPYAVYFFYGTYDIPRKASDKGEQWESEEMYRFMVCAVCPLQGEYEPGEPEFGFLFPSFCDRSTDIHGISFYQLNPADKENPLKNLFC